MVEDLVFPGIFLVLVLVAAIIEIIVYRQRNKALHPPPTPEELTKQTEKELREINQYIDKLEG